MSVKLHRMAVGRRDPRVACSWFLIKLAKIGFDIVIMYINVQAMSGGLEIRIYF
jgi:hypothetical protein